MDVRWIGSASRKSVADRPFNLLRSFSLLSLICIVLMSLTSAWLLSHFLRSHLLQREAVVTAQFVQSIMASMDPSVYFPDAQREARRLSYTDLFEPKNRSHVIVALEAFFQRLAVMPEVVRANVYASDQTLIWCDTPELIGQRFADNRELRQALRGQTVAKTGTANRHKKAEHVRFDPGVRDFAESYIPVWNTSHDTVIGVVEVYKEPQALFQMIARGRRLIWASTLGGGLFLYAALFGIVRRASWVMREQGEQLVQSETLATIGEMASTIAHNIRNPLAAIRTSAELIYEAEDTLAVQPRSEDIMTEVDRLAGWLRTLLTYAHPFSHTSTSVQLADLVRDVVQQVTARLDKQKVQLQVDVPETLPPLRADAVLLQQTLYSVIANALDTMPQGGILIIAAVRLATRGQVQLKIRDTGQGLPARHLAQAFRPFFTTKQRGLGLGLAFAKRIVDRHGGTIELSSQEGHGTTVTLTLPTPRRMRAWRTVWSSLKTKRPWRSILPPT